MENNNMSIFNKIFAWLGVGLILSFGIGYYLSNNVHIVADLLSGTSYYAVIITPLALAFIFKIFINKLPAPILYILYAVFASIIGITFATVFLIYEMSSIISIFLLTSLIFIAMAIYGYVTKKDLTSIGRILMIALIVIIIFSLINMFIFQSSTFELVISAISALVFTGFIAYDIQKIKLLIGTMEEEKLQIYGAFELYLDFINLFLDLLRLFGRRN